MISYHSLQLGAGKGTCTTKFRPLLPSTLVGVGKSASKGGSPHSRSSAAQNPRLARVGLAVSTGPPVAARAEPYACTVSHACGGLLLLEGAPPGILQGCPSSQPQIRHGPQSQMSAGTRHGHHTCEAQACAAGGLNKTWGRPSLSAGTIQKTLRHACEAGTGAAGEHLGTACPEFSPAARASRAACSAGRSFAVASTASVTSGREYCSHSGTSAYHQLTCGPVLSFLKCRSVLNMFVGCGSARGQSCHRWSRPASQHTAQLHCPSPVKHGAPGL